MCASPSNKFPNFQLFIVVAIRERNAKKWGQPLLHHCSERQNHCCYCNVIYMFIQSQVHSTWWAFQAIPFAADTGVNIIPPPPFFPTARSSTLKSPLTRKHLELRQRPIYIIYQIFQWSLLLKCVPCSRRDRRGISYRRYFQHAHFIPIVGVGKRSAY